MKTTDCTAQVTQVPADLLFKEGASQKNRMVQQVMEALFEHMPESGEELVLSDGTECRIKKFSPPRERGEKEIEYGFDVTFPKDHALSHLEFFVRCSGWGRQLVSDTECSAVAENS